MGGEGKQGMTGELSYGGRAVWRRGLGDSGQTPGWAGWTDEVTMVMNPCVCVSVSICRACG